MKITDDIKTNAANETKLRLGSSAGSTSTSKRESDEH